MNVGRINDLFSKDPFWIDPNDIQILNPKPFGQDKLRRSLRRRGGGKPVPEASTRRSREEDGLGAINFFWVLDREFMRCYLIDKDLG